MGGETVAASVPVAPVAAVPVLGLGAEAAPVRPLSGDGGVGRAAGPVTALRCTAGAPGLPGGAHCKHHVRGRYGGQ
ncbi:hypothetical protein [Streptomyces sp. NPDC001076]